MINTTLITPRNFIVVGIMAVVAHIITRPIYNIVEKKD